MQDLAGSVDPDKIRDVRVVTEGNPHVLFLHLTKE
jgi:hypothetical protein